MPDGFEPNFLIQIYHKPEKKNTNLIFAICASPIIHLVAPQYLFFFLFLLDITVVPRERKDNACAIFLKFYLFNNFFDGGGGGGGGGSNEGYYGRCANSQ